MAFELVCMHNDLCISFVLFCHARAHNLNLKINPALFKKKSVILHNSALLVELVVLERSEQVAIGIHIRSLSIGEGDSGLKMVGFVLRLASLNNIQIYESICDNISVSRAIFDLFG